MCTSILLRSRCLFWTAPSQPFIVDVRSRPSGACATRRRYLKVLQPLELAAGDRRIGLYPCDEFRVHCMVDFAHPAIGRQEIELSVKISTPSAPPAGPRALRLRLSRRGRKASRRGPDPRRLPRKRHRADQRRSMNERIALSRRVRPPQDARPDRRPGPGWASSAGPACVAHKAGHAHTRPTEFRACWLIPRCGPETFAGRRLRCAGRRKPRPRAFPYAAGVTPHPKRTRPGCTTNWYLETRQAIRASARAFARIADAQEKSRVPHPGDPDRRAGRSASRGWPKATGRAQEDERLTSRSKRIDASRANHFVDVTPCPRLQIGPFLTVVKRDLRFCAVAAGTAVIKGGRITTVSSHGSVGFLRRNPGRGQRYAACAAESRQGSASRPADAP